MLQNAYQQYQQQSVNTMTPMEIILKLYGEAEKEIAKAIHFIDKGILDQANQSIIKTQSIMHTLRSSLDMKYEVSANLSALYEYFSGRLLEANLKKDRAILEELAPMIAELRATFAQINKLPRTH